MPLVLTVVARLVLLAAGLLLAAGVAACGLLLALLWAVRAAWCRLTGRPVLPFAVRFMRPGAFRPAPAEPQAPQEPAWAPARPQGRLRPARDAVDVQAK